MRPDSEKRIHNILETEPVLRPPEVSAEVFEKFCALFFESVPQLILSLKQQPEDRVGIKKSAHRLKGACGFAGAVRLGAVAAELEQVALSGSDEELEFFYNTLEQVLAQTRVAMTGGT